MIYVSFILLLIASILGQRFQLLPFHISLGVLAISILGLAGYSASQIKQNPMAAIGLLPLAISLFFAVRGLWCLAWRMLLPDGSLKLSIR